MAITKTIQATVKNRTDTAANWTQKNPVLAEGEIIVVQTSAGETRLKIGDGVKTFTQLPYTDEQIYNNVVTSVNGQTGDVTFDIPGGSADWAQNDPTAKDYIKNRPGGYDVVTPEKIISERQLNAEYFEAPVELSEPLVAGRSYRCTFYEGANQSNTLFDGEVVAETITDPNNVNYGGIILIMTSCGQIFQPAAYPEKPAIYNGNKFYEFGYFKIISYAHTETVKIPDKYITNSDFIITATPESPELDAITLDKTFDQIREAILDGKRAVLHLSHHAPESENVFSSLQLSENVPFGVTFSGVDIGPDGVVYGISISIDNKNEIRIFSGSAPAITPDGMMEQVEMSAAPTSDMQIATKKYVDDRTSDSVLYTYQSLTDAQKKQARENINADRFEVEIYRDRGTPYSDKTAKEIYDAFASGKTVEIAVDFVRAMLTECRMQNDKYYISCYVPRVTEAYTVVGLGSYMLYLDGVLGTSRGMWKEGLYNVTATAELAPITGVVTADKLFDPDHPTDLLDYEAFMAAVPLVQSMGITGATVGQIAKIAAVNESGVPTTWSPVDMPDKLPNPNALTFTGAVTGSYDGSAPMSVEIPTVPTKTSQLTNDSGFLTSHQSLAAYRTAAAQDIIDSGKVDKVTGKGLSTNDYTAAAKAKVDAIPANPKYTDTVYDDTALKERVATIEGKESAWDAKSDFSGSYNDLTDKPTIPTALPNPNALTFTGAVAGTYDGSQAVTINIPEGSAGNMKKLTFTGAVTGEYDGTTDVNIDIPIATSSTAGTIKVGNGLSISADGTLSVTTATYYTGTADPVNTLGADGDLYLKTEG